eukprot:6811828-Prymnesium_polylepis.1
MPTTASAPPPHVLPPHVLERGPVIGEEHATRDTVASQSPSSSSSTAAGLAAGVVEPGSKVPKMMSARARSSAASSMRSSCSRSRERAISALTSFSSCSPASITA